MAAQASRPARSGASTRGAGPTAGFLAAVALAGLTFGVPVALFVFGRDMIPTTVARPSQMWAALRQPDDGHIFLQGLYLAAWVAWFFFFLSVFLEIVARVQHRAAIRLPGLAWLQRGVGTLVTAAVVIIGSPVAAMATAPGPALSSAHVGGGTVATATFTATAYQTTTVDEAPDVHETPNPTYTVRPGDSLWLIAQRQLGDPNRFADIAKLNDGRVMPGGTVFHYAEFLRPGWVLLMPAGSGPDTATEDGQTGPGIDSLAVREPTAAHAPKTYTVRSGDSLASIAKAQLGDADRWNELFDLNRGKPQPGGPPIWRPDLIWPGDILILPADAGTAPHQQTAPKPPATSVSVPLIAPAPPAEASPPAEATRPAENTAPAQLLPMQVAPPADAEDFTTAPAHSTSAGKTMGAVGGLLAAGLLTALGAKRLNRLRRRRPGQNIPLPPPKQWELELRTVENPTGRVLIDAALRTLAVRLAEVDRILPDLTATVMKPHGLELHLSRMEPPVAPFYADASRPGIWICPLGAPLAAMDLRKPSRAPYPALVSLGFDEGDDSVLVDLEATRGVSLLAPTDESVGMLRALAIELATGAWADQLAVTLVGFGAELPDLFAPGCLVHEDALAPAVEALAEWSAHVEGILDKRDVSLREARTYPDDELAAVTKTHVLLSAIPLDAPSAYRLRQILSGRQRTSVAVVALIRDSDHLLSPWAVTGPSFRTPQTQSGGPGLRVRMQALREDQYSAIIRDLSGVDLDDEWARQQQTLAAPRSQPQLLPPTQSPTQQPPPQQPTQQPNRFRIPIDDLFRAETLPPAADPSKTGIRIVPLPGSASAARHALNPANLPQFDLVVTHWHGDSDTEQILAVPNAAPPAIEARPPLPGLTGFAPAGVLAPPPTTGPSTAVATTTTTTGTALEKRPGEWQSAYWSQRKAATAERDQSGTETAGIDPAAMSRTVDILGPIDLSGSPGIAGSRAADLAEVAAFIVLHPYCSANQIAAELWPGRTGAITIRDAQIARLRDWLGTDAYGDNHLQTTEDGGYRMGPSVSCDWLEFTARVKVGELVAAISLVRGRPFEGAPLRRYGWAESLRQEMTALIIDTAHFVAEACLHEQNPRGAQNAAYRGLQAAPESELLYRDLLTALSGLGDLQAARHHADTLIAYADREGLDLQPETTALLRDVLQAVTGG